MARKISFRHPLDAFNVNRVLFAALLLFSSLPACGPKPCGYQEHLGQPDRPKWVDEPRSADSRTHMAFVGVSAKYAAEAPARSDARLRAYEEATERLGTAVLREVTRVTAQEGLADEVINPAEVREEVTRLISSGHLVAQVDEYFVDRYRLHQGQATQYFYVVHALLKVPRMLVDQAAVNTVARFYNGEHDAESLERARRLIEEKGK